MTLALRDRPPADPRSYALDPDYLAASQALGVGERIAYLEALGGIVPMIRRSLGARLFDLRTPTGFPGPSNPDLWLVAWPEIARALADLGCVSLYMQCRSEAHGVAPAGALVDTARFRTVYVLDLAPDLDAIRARCRRDTRQRVNQMLRASYRVGDALSPDFARAYAAIAERNGFSALYRLNDAQFRAIASVRRVRYVEAADPDNGFIGGGFLGEGGETADYLYSAYDDAIPNAGRILLWHVIVAAKAAGWRRLNLGGGIAESDSLASFKESFGAVPERWTAIRAITDAAAAERLAGAPVGTDWFDGYFPKYVQDSRRAA